MTMSKIVLDMVTLGFENVVILVFNLPAGTPILTMASTVVFVTSKSETKAFL